MPKTPRGFTGRLRADGLPDRRTMQGKAFWRRSEASQRAAETREKHRKQAEREARRQQKQRSEAARKGWETRKQREREQREPWPISETQEYIVEEPIETVGGKRYGKKGR